MMFREGMKVWSILQGWGVVIYITKGEFLFPVRVKFESGIIDVFTKDGRPYGRKHCRQELYETEMAVVPVNRHQVKRADNDKNKKWEVLV